MSCDGLPLAAHALAEGRVLKDVAFRLKDPAGVIALKKPEPGATGSAGRKRFRMTALSGQTFFHPWWGMTAVDLKGVRPAAKRLAVLREHFPDRIVGYSESVEVDDSVDIEGPFSEVTADGKEVEALSGEGFPWQASIGFEALSREFVREGTEVEVNGKKLRGPGTVFRKILLREASFVSVGADPGTSAESIQAAADPQEPLAQRRESLMAAFSYLPTGGQPMDKDDNTKATGSGAPSQGASPPAPGATGTGAPPPAPGAGGQAAAFSAAEIQRLIASGIQEGLKALRETRKSRFEKLKPLAFSNQDALLEELVDSEKPIEECAALLVKDFKERGGAKLAALQKDPAPGVQAGNGDIPVENHYAALRVSDQELIASGTVDKEKASAKYKASAEVQAEFASETDYIAYLAAAASGKHRFRLIEGRKAS